MKRHAISILLFIVAIACYAVGAAGPGIAFFVLGGIAELTFWVRIFNRSDQSKPSS